MQGLTLFFNKRMQPLKLSWFEFCCHHTHAFCHASAFVGYHSSETKKPFRTQKKFRTQLLLRKSNFIPDPFYPTPIPDILFSYPFWTFFVFHFGPFVLKSIPDSPFHFWTQKISRIKKKFRTITDHSTPNLSHLLTHTPLLTYFNLTHLFSSFLL